MMLAACHEPEPVATPDAPDPCREVQQAASFVGSTVVGPVSGTSVTVPIMPTSGGQMLVVAVAGTLASTRYPRMIGGDTAFQVGTANQTCGKNAALFSVGNIEPGVSSFTVQSEYGSPSDTFVVFVMSFAGLDPATGARLSYDFGHGGYAPLACPGTVIASVVTSCGDVALSPESPFEALAPIDGMATAYYIPSAYAEYGANWRATDTMSTAIVELE